MSDDLAAGACGPPAHQNSFINSSGHPEGRADWAKENPTVRKTISLILALVFVLSLGSLTFAQNSNTSTTTNSNSSMGGGHHRRHHRRSHRRHGRRGGAMKNANANT
jgi:hypothetical protein